MHGTTRIAHMDEPPGLTLPPAVVLNLQESGLAILRSLGRRGVRVVGLSKDPKAPGAASRYGRFRNAPDSLTAPAALLDSLLVLARELGERAVLFPTNDADLAFLDRHRAALGETFILALPAGPPLRDLTDKARLAEVAETHGVTAPVTKRVRSVEELQQVVFALPYPAVIKPVDTSAWRAPAFYARFHIRKGWRVSNPDECATAYNRLAEVTPEVLIQEWIPGPENAYDVVGAVTGPGGQPLGAFAGRKLMQHPPGIGLGCLMQSVDDPALLDESLGFLERIGYHGICEIEFKRDARTGRRRLIEINPRHWDQHGLAPHLGVDLTWIYYRDLIGLPPEPLATPTRHAVWVRGRGVFGAVKHALRHRDGAILRPLWRSLWKSKSWAYWAAEDPGPGLGGLGRRLRRAREKGGRR